MPAADPPLASSVVICSRDRPQMLVETVRSVLAGGRVPSEIVVIDQSPVAHTELARMGTVRSCRVRYFHSPVPGVSRGRNLGFRLAAEEVVVVLDDDLIVQRDSLQALLAARVGAIAPTVTTGRVLAAPPDRPGLTQPATALITASAPEVFRGRQPRQVVPGPNISLPRELLLELGGYDERLGPGTRFPAAEDRDLSLRLLDAGCEVRHVPDAVVLHRSWRTNRDLLRLRWRYARGVGAFYAKHASLRDRHVLGRAFDELRTRVRLALTSLRGSPRTSGLHVISMAGLLTGAVDWTIRYRLPRRRPPTSRRRIP